MPKWLKCKIAKGMFSDEVTVIVRTRGGEEVSVFVPKNATEEAQSRVKVRVAECEGRSIAWLPDEHQSVVDVDSADLQPA
jgi:hypothetical protein